MSVRNKIQEIFNENYKSLNGAFGEKQNKGKMYLRREDAKRKRIERSKNKPKKDDKIEQDLDPSEIIKQQRRQLQGGLRLTPLETFTSKLIYYVETRKPKHILDAIELMEDYPKLGKYVKEQSKKCLPKYEFCAYAMRERLDEEIGQLGKRIDGDYHNWTLSRANANSVFNECDSPYLMECKINPSDVIIYIPAFTKLMEKLIIEGLIEEPSLNVIRESKKREEIILPGKYNEGYIIGVN